MYTVRTDRYGGYDTFSKLNHWNLVGVIEKYYKSHGSTYIMTGFGSTKHFH